MSEAERNFRISVTGLGCLGPTTVELRPLTLFVGENNSGKRYLSTVIWALAQVPIDSVIDALDSLGMWSRLREQWASLGAGDDVQWLSRDDANNLLPRLHNTVVPRAISESF